MVISKALIIISLFFAVNLSAQDELPAENEAFYFDAIVFKSDSTGGNSRVDVYTIIPYASLQFSNYSSMLGAKYDLTVTAYDSTGAKFAEKRVSRSLVEKDYYVVRGGTGAFDYAQVSFDLPGGSYKIRALVADNINKNEFERSRTVSVIDFSKYDFSTSGIMLVSAIEEVDGKFIITPHISDNLANLTEGFFAFMELYNRRGLPEAMLDWELVDYEGKTIKKGDPQSKKLNPGSNQVYLSIPKLSGLPTGGYTLKIYARGAAGETLGVAQRSIKFLRSFGGNVLSNIDESIKQLRYVARQSEIEAIEGAPTEEERRARFDEFWRKLDPTPNTERNEAFDEYYGRIAFANNNFRSYTQGWLTDKGMVYIVYGAPFNIERSQNYSDGRVYERWTYRSGREFIFVDNTGFGDYRLYRPMSVTDKYRYE